MAGDQRSKPPYERPRVYGAAALIGAAIVMLIMDVLSKDYSLSDGTLGILVGGAGALLAVEIGFGRGK